MVNRLKEERKMIATQERGFLAPLRSYLFVPAHRDTLIPKEGCRALLKPSLQDIQPTDVI